MVLDATSQYTNALNPDTSNASMATSLFLSDHSVHAGLRRGFVLSTFRTQRGLSLSGSEYEYVVFNARDVLVPHRIEEIRRKDQLVDSIKAAEVLGGGMLWKQDPPILTLSTPSLPPTALGTARHPTVTPVPQPEQPIKARTHTVHCELMDARGFDGRRVFVTYFVSLPATARLRTGDLTDGEVGPTGVGTGVVEADFPGRWGLLQGRTHVATACCDSAFRVRGWTLNRYGRRRGDRVAAALSAGTRLALGVSLLVISVLGVIVLGDEHPFWVVPALLLVFLGGSRGFAFSPSPSVRLSQQRTPTTQSLVDKGRETDSGGHWRERDSERVGERDHNGEVSVCAFNHLFYFSYDDAVREREALCGERETAKVYFQVYSCDTGIFPSLGPPSSSVSVAEKGLLEGYGVCNVPLVGRDAKGGAGGGEFVLEIPCWKPRGGIRSDMRAFYLGDAVRLKSETFVDSLDSVSAALNKCGVLCESTGVLRVRGSVIVTDPSLIRSLSPQDALAPTTEGVLGSGRGSGRVGGASVLGSIAVPIKAKTQRSVQDILKSYKAAQTLSRSRAGSASVSANVSASNSSVNLLASKRASLTLTASRTRLSEGPGVALERPSGGGRAAEILARVRSKRESERDRDEAKGEREMVPLIARDSAEEELMAMLQPAQAHSPTGPDPTESSSSRVRPSMSSEASLGLTSGRRDRIENARKHAAAVTNRYPDEIEEGESESDRLLGPSVSARERQREIEKERDTPPKGESVSARERPRDTPSSARETERVTPPKSARETPVVSAREKREPPKTEPPLSARDRQKERDAEKERDTPPKTARERERVQDTPVRDEREGGSVSAREREKARETPPLSARAKEGTLSARERERDRPDKDSPPPLSARGSVRGEGLSARERGTPIAEEKPKSARGDRPRSAVPTPRSARREEKRDAVEDEKDDKVSSAVDDEITPLIG